MLTYQKGSRKKFCGQTCPRLLVTQRLRIDIPREKKICLVLINKYRPRTKSADIYYGPATTAFACRERGS